MTQMSWKLKTDDVQNTANDRKYIMMSGFPFKWRQSGNFPNIRYNWIEIVLNNNHIHVLADFSTINIWPKTIAFACWAHISFYISWVSIQWKKITRLIGTNSIHMSYVWVSNCELMTWNSKWQMISVNWLITTSNENM